MESTIDLRQTVAKKMAHALRTGATKRAVDKSQKIFEYNTAEAAHSNTSHNINLPRIQTSAANSNKRARMENQQKSNETKSR